MEQRVQETGPVFHGVGQGQLPVEDHRFPGGPLRLGGFADPAEPVAQIGERACVVRAVALRRLLELGLAYGHRLPGALDRLLMPVVPREGASQVLQRTCKLRPPAGVIILPLLGHRDGFFGDAEPLGGCETPPTREVRQDPAQQPRRITGGPVPGQVAQDVRRFLGRRQGDCGPTRELQVDAQTVQGVGQPNQQRRAFPVDRSVHKSPVQVRGALRRPDALLVQGGVEQPHADLALDVGLPAGGGGRIQQRRFERQHHGGDADVEFAVTWGEARGDGQK